RGHALGARSRRRRAGRRARLRRAGGAGDRAGLGRARVRRQGALAGGQRGGRRRRGGDVHHARDAARRRAPRACAAHLPPQRRDDPRDRRRRARRARDRLRRLDRRGAAAAAWPGRVPRARRLAAAAGRRRAGDPERLRRPRGARRRRADHALPRAGAGLVAGLGRPRRRAARRMTAAAALALAPDPALPGRDTLLDGGAMAERLAPLLRAEGPLERCRRVLVRYDPGQRLAVLYGIRAGGAEHRVVASAYADEARMPPGFAHDRELGAVLWTFPDDPRLGGLTSIADWSQTAGALLGRGGVRAQLARYVPEHRAVARCVDPGGATVAYAKVYRDGEGDRVARLQAALAGRLAGDPDLRIPRVLGFSRNRRLLVVEALDGQGLLAARGEALEDGVSRLGAGLARLHGLGPASGTAWSFGVRLRRRLDAMASAVGRMRPDARDAAGDLARALGAPRPSAAEPLVLVHGDAALKNAVFDGRGVALVDLDDAKPG